MATTGVFGFNTLVYLSFSYTTAINAALVHALPPALIVLVSRFTLGEQTTARQLVGLLVSIFGATAVITRGSWQALYTLQFNTGDLLMILAAATWTVYSVLGKYVMQRYTPLVATYYATIIGIIMLVPLATWEMTRYPVPGISTAGFFSLVYIGLFASFTAFLFWIAACRQSAPVAPGSFPT